jgi:acyl dehydratase
MGEAAAMTLDSLHELEGNEVAVTDWIVVSQERIDLFAEATEDRQWIHIDQERAALESPYGAPVAHGFLTLSMLSHLSRHVLPVEGVSLRVNYGLNRVRFPAAVRAGSKIRGRFTLFSAKDFAAGGTGGGSGGIDLTLAVTMELEGSAKPCCVAEWIVRYYR